MLGAGAPSLVQSCLQIPLEIFAPLARRLQAYCLASHLSTPCFAHESNSNQRGDGIHREKQLERLAGQGDEAELPIELGYPIIQGMDDRGVDRHQLAGVGDALQAVGDQDRAEPLALVAFCNGERSLEDHQNQIPGQSASKFLWLASGSEATVC